MKKLFTFIICFSLISFTYAQDTWVIDAAHSSVEFEVSHLTVSSVTGFFTSFSGSLTTEKDNNFEGAKVNTSIQVASVTTNNLERDKHLKEDDFFNAAQYPVISFNSTSFTKESDGNYTLTGDLTIRDVTKKVELDVDFGGVITLYNATRAGFTATGAINRFDFGLKWDDSLDSGGLIVGEKVDITLKVEAIKQ